MLPVSQIKDGKNLIENTCYFYQFDGTIYTLTAIASDQNFTELIVETGDELYAKVAENAYEEIDVNDYDVIAVVSREAQRTESSDWVIADTTSKFVDAETLAEMLDECEATLDEDDYHVSFDYYFAAYTDVYGNEALWVIIVKNIVIQAPAATVTVSSPVDVFVNGVVYTAPIEAKIGDALTLEFASEVIVSATGATCTMGESLQTWTVTVTESTVVIIAAQ